MRVFSICKDRMEKGQRVSVKETHRARDVKPWSLCPVSALIRIGKSHVQMAAMAARLSASSALQFCTQLLMKLIGYVSG